MLAIRASLVVASLVIVVSAADGGATATQSGSKLVVKCDDASTVLFVDGLDRLGELTLFVDSNPVGEFRGVRDIDVKGGKGDDELFLGGLRIGGTLKAKLGAGNDLVSINTSRAVAGDQRAVFIGQSVDLALGGQPGDLVYVDVAAQAFGITIGKDFVARDAADYHFDGEGTTTEFEVDDVSIGGQLKLRGKIAADLTGDSANVGLSNVNVGGATTIDLGGDDDRVELRDCSLGGKFTAKLGAGDDSFEAGFVASVANAFFGSVSIRGGSGEADSITMNVNEFVQQPSITQFEVGP